VNKRDAPEGVQARDNTFPNRGIKEVVVPQVSSGRPSVPAPKQTSPKGQRLRNEVW
jgi:hypothetical protein